MSLNSGSSSGDSFTIEFDEWEARVCEQNQQIDHILEDMLIANQQTTPPLRRFVNRECQVGEERLMNDYFVERPTYTPESFRRRFRMCRPLFLRIVEAVSASNEYFQQRRDAAGRQSLSALQKCTVATRVLAYETSADVVDEYLRMGEFTIRKTLVKFVDGVISYFGPEYLRKPNEQYLARLLYVEEQRGFPGMIDSVDCMHWEWKNYPSAWAGQYAGRSGNATIILEAVASYDLWICHAFFGTPGTCNDINVLERSPVFTDVLEGRAPKVSYIVNGCQNDMAYYLTDETYPAWAAFVKLITSPEIYPAWAAFVKPITSPSTLKHKLFAQHQEAARKEWSKHLEFYKLVLHSFNVHVFFGTRIS